MTFLGQIPSTKMPPGVILIAQPDKYNRDPTKRQGFLLQC